MVELLGLLQRLLEANKVHNLNSPVSILEINALRTEFNITSGVKIIDKKVYTIHKFFSAVPPGYKIFEVS